MLPASEKRECVGHVARIENLLTDYDVPCTFLRIMGDSEFAPKDELEATREVVYEHAQKLDELSQKLEDLSQKLDELSQKADQTTDKFNDIDSTLSDIKSKVGS